MAKGKGPGSKTAYAEVKWTPGDVKTLRPGWSLRRCERFLRDNERCMVDRLIELGWDVIGDLLPKGRRS